MKILFSIIATTQLGKTSNNFIFDSHERQLFTYENMLYQDSLKIILILNQAHNE